jgi:transposase
MRPISNTTKQNIEALPHEGLSVRDIAEKLRISTFPVNKVRQTCLACLPRAKAGRPKRLSEQDKRACVRSITRGNAETATGVAKQIEKDMGIRVSRYTVATAMKQSGMHSAEKQEKPRLSAKNVKARLEFALAHRDWTVENWKRVI